MKNKKDNIALRFYNYLYYWRNRKHRSINSRYISFFDGPGANNFAFIYYFILALDIVSIPLKLFSIQLGSRAITLLLVLVGIVLIFCFGLYEPDFDELDKKYHNEKHRKLKGAIIHLSLVFLIFLLIALWW